MSRFPPKLCICIQPATQPLHMDGEQTVKYHILQPELPNFSSKFFLLESSGILINGAQWTKPKIQAPSFDQLSFLTRTSNPLVSPTSKYIPHLVLPTMPAASILVHASTFCSTLTASPASPLANSSPPCTAARDLSQN